MSLLKQLSILVLLSVFLAGTLYCFSGKLTFAEVSSDKRMLTLEQALSLPHILWVDAREEKYYNKNHIPNAVLLNLDRWNDFIPAFLDAWQPESSVVVYCSSQQCDSSKSVAARLMEDLNIQKVYILRDGWEAWQSTLKK